MSVDSRIGLNDEYTIREGHALVEGRQGLGRLSIARRALDKQMGHAIGGYTELCGSEIAA